MAALVTIAAFGAFSFVWYAVCCCSRVHCDAAHRFRDEVNNHNDCNTSYQCASLAFDAGLHGLVQPVQPAH